MAEKDPFTLDMFGSTALTSGLGLGVNAFAGDFSVEPDNDDDPDPSTPPPSAPALPAPPIAQTRPAPLKAKDRGSNFYLGGDRGLAAGWKNRARDNIEAIRLAAEIEQAERPATPGEQARLVRFTGFGACDLANGVFRRPGEGDFREGWDELGADLEDGCGRTAIRTRCWKT